MAERVCPVWIGYLLAHPVRRLIQKPEKIIGPYIKPGMMVVDVGCAMGFFSIPAARLVGPQGRVICVDLQPKMIRSLRKRAEKAGVSERIDGRVCSRSSLQISDLAGLVDFALAFAVVHEVPDMDGLFKQLFEALVPGGRLLVAEPKGHVPDDRFAEILATARGCGFELVKRSTFAMSLSVVLAKPALANVI